MDIAGAKALKKGLGKDRLDDRLHEARSGTVDVTEGAPPVYQWLGLSRVAPDTPDEAEDHEAPPQVRSMFRGLRLGSR